MACSLPPSLNSLLGACTGFATPAANRLVLGGVMCIASVLAVVATWFTHNAAQPGGVQASLDFWGVRLNTQFL